MTSIAKIVLSIGMLQHRASRALALWVMTILVSITQTANALDKIETSIFQAVFYSDEPVAADKDVIIDLGRDFPLSAHLRTTSGAGKAVIFNADLNRISLKVPSAAVSGIAVLFRAEKTGAADLERSVFIDDEIVSGRWDNSGSILLGDLSSITDSLAIGSVAAADTHFVSFSTTTSPLSDSAIIWVTLPQGFTYGVIGDTAYMDDDPSNDSNEPVISSATVNGQTIQLQLNSGAQQAAAGSRITVRFAEVNNSSAAGDYTAVVMTTDADGFIDNGPGVSAPFTLVPDALDHININPGTPLSVPSDSIVNFDVRGYDQFANEIDGIVFTYALTVDSCGEIFGSDFRALKVGNCYFTASAQGISDSSGLISVVPGPLDRFTLTGYPGQTYAGNRFIAPVAVTAYDLNSNIKTNYTGNVWFTSSDPNATLPYTSGNQYTFTPGDAGIHSFPGVGFILRTSGLRTITITNGSISKSSDLINVLPSVIVSFDLTAGSPQIAGQSFQLQASSAVDSLGNAASGEIIIADSVGGGDSPDGIPPSLNTVIVTSGFGTSFQILTNAVPTVLKGTVSGTFAVAATDTMLVYPGNLGRFEIAGYPTSTVAGNQFPDQGIAVSVFDLFGNLKTNYADSVYFISSDTLAVLPYTQSSKYKFQIADSGSHTFPGAGFILYIAEYQTITVTDGAVSAMSEPIDVLPGAIADFIIFAPDSITAGTPFAVNVSDCRDAWQNPTNGIVNVADSIGGGSSPDGSQPVFNSIRVILGSGGANQTLVNALTTVLKGYSGSVIEVTGNIAVVPGDIESFALNLSSPQTSGLPFYGTADLSALDSYGNIKTDFDASADTVVISSSGDGTMQNNILKFAGDFVDGAADLISLGTAFTGRGGDMTFTALSQSGASGISGQIDMQAIYCSGLVIDQGVLSWGDTATGVISVINDGGVAVRITDLDVLTGTGLVLHPSFTNPPLPDSIDPGIHVNYNIEIPINSGLQIGIHPVTGAVRGFFGANTVEDTLAGFPDTIEVQQASQIGYVDGSLNRDTLSAAETYALSIRLSNIGDAGLGLIDTSYIYFTDGVSEYKANLRNGIYLPPDNPSGTELTFDSALVDPDFVEGAYTAKFHYFGQENGHFVSDSVAITDVITIQAGAVIGYIAGSMNIDTLVAGQIAAFAVRVTNSGSADFIVDHDNTRIRLSDTQREYIAYSDTTFGLRVDRIDPGDTTFYFLPSLLSAEFSVGDHLPSVTIDGIQNGIAQTIIFDTNPDSIAVISVGKLRIDSTFFLSRNAPLVNTSQACSARVVISNIGDEGVDSIYIRLTSDGFSGFSDSLFLGSIEPHSDISFNYPVMAAAGPDSGEVFVSSIFGGIGSRSSMAPLFISPLDNAAILIIETAAELSLSSISVTRPPGAQDDTVSIGQNVTISGVVNNLGQADISGTRSLVLDIGTSGFSVIDSTTRDYQAGQDVFWDIVAPSNPVSSAVLSVRFAVYPSDVNDGSSAVGPDSVSSIEFVVETRPSISHTPVINAPPGAGDGVLSTDQMCRIADTLAAFGEYRDLTVSISLPYGFTTDDSLIKYPSGGVSDWDIRAPSDTTVDSVAVTAWLYDINTGDSISVGPDYIRTQVIEGARLSLDSRISGPVAALDDIIEPGAYLEYEAVVSNQGQAAAGGGLFSLHIGHPDLTTTDPLTRAFTPGIPVVWVVSAPAYELSSAVAISVTIDSIPDDENTSAPALVINDYSSLFVSVREFLPRLEFAVASVHSGSVVKGQILDYLSFTLKNNDRGGSFPIGLTGMRLKIESNYPDQGEGIIPLSLAALFSDTLEISGAISSGEINFLFQDTLIILPGESIPLDFRIGISSVSAASDFSLSIEDGDIDGVVYDEGTVAGEIAARSVGGGDLWESAPIAILEQSFAGSISSYPNPFNPRQSPARIGYFLDSDSRIRVRIFTLMGELVWSVDIPASDPLGRAGLHTGDTALLWFGKNSSGYEVHTGVYICIIENVSQGREERFKIAVVK